MTGRIAALSLTLWVTAPAVAGVLVAPSPCAAQRSGRADQNDQAGEADARRLFQEAAGALEGGRFAEARDLLRRSIELSPNVGSAFNLGVALRGTGEVRGAVRIFEALLEEEYGTISGTQVREVRRLLRQTRAEIAVLHIEGTGAEAIVIRVDGEQVAEVEDGESVAHEVDPGDHVVTAWAPRHGTEERRVHLDRGGSRRLQIGLEMTADARLGTLVVEGVDDDDILEIVDVGRGTGVLSRDLEPGSYEVIVAGPGGRRESTVDLEAGTTLRVRLDVDSGGGVASSPWFWTGVGLVVVGLVVGTALLLVETEGDPVTDPVYGVVTTLTLP